MRSHLLQTLILVLSTQIALGPLATARAEIARAPASERRETMPPRLYMKLQEWILAVRQDPAHANVLWVLKQMNDFANDPASAREIAGPLAKRFRELRKDMLHASAFHQRMDECAGREKHADAAVDDLEFRYVLRSIQNPNECTVCRADTPERREYYEKVGRPFASGSFVDGRPGYYSVPEVMAATNRAFGFGDPDHDGQAAEYRDAAKLMSESVLETQKNVLRNYIYFKEHFEVEAEKPKTGLVPKPKDGLGYVHSLFFACHDPETGEYAPPLIGCSGENFYDTEGELQRFASAEIAAVRERFGKIKGAAEVYRDLEPIFQMMEEDERDAVVREREMVAAIKAEEKRRYLFEQRSGLKRDGILNGLPKLQPFVKNTYFKTREMIAMNIGHESAFLFQTEALNLKTAALAKNRSPAARIGLVRDAIREVVRGTRDYANYIKRKGGTFNGFRQPKDLKYVNETTNMLVRTSPNAVVKTLYDDGSLVRASCASIRQMAKSYRQTGFERVLLWGGILVAGVTIAIITGGLAIPGFAALTTTYGLLGYTTAAGISLTLGNLGNNLWRSSEGNYSEQIRTLKGAMPAVDRYTNEKLELDLADAVAQYKKLNIRILWNLIDLATYAAMPLISKAWDKFLQKHLNKTDPNDMFVVKHTGDERFVSLIDADGHKNYAKVLASTEDGTLTRMHLLKENQDVVVTTAERALWKVDAHAKLAFDQRSASALMDVKDVSEIGLGIKLKFSRLSNGTALPTAIGVAPSVKDSRNQRRERVRSKGDRPSRKLKRRKDDPDGDPAPRSSPRPRPN